MAEFAESVRRAFITLYKYSDESIDVFQEAYPSWAANVDGAPTVEELTVEDVPALRSHGGIRSDESWGQFKVRIAKDDETDTARQNPFLPNWISKTDDRQRMWVTDTLNDPTGSLEVPERVVENMKKVLTEACTYSLDRVREPLVNGPAVEWMAMRDVTKVMKSNLKLFFHSCGNGEDASFKWSIVVSLLAGLGYKGFMEVGRALVGEEHWDFFQSLDQEQWITEVCKCRDICGYPVGLYRADALSLYHAVNSDLDAPPKWLTGVFALHMCKHVRLNPDGENPYLMVAYNGMHATIPLSPESLDQPLNSVANSTCVGKMLCSVLNLPYAAPSARTRTQYNGCVDKVLARFHPRNFAYQHRVDEKPTYVIPPGIRVVAEADMTYAKPWIHTGIAVKNVAVIDAKTGVVDKHGTVNGPDSIGFTWPRNAPRENAMDTWRDMLPDVVPSLPPSELLKMFIKNINYLGHARAWGAVIDATMVLDTLRFQLAGSEAGSLIHQEFPILAVYPTGFTRDDTTNQGKTNLCRLLLGTLAPGIGVSPMNVNPSAPMQRSLAAPLYSHGTLLLDEFKLAQSDQHFLCKEGLQSLCSGGKVTPGVAGGNDPGVGLRHPISFSAKVSAIPPDMRNRQFPSFMDALTDETRCDPAILNIIASPKAPMRIRLSMLRWIHDTDLLNKILGLKLQGDKCCRFDAHYAVACLLVEMRGGDRKELASFFDATNRQCDEQLRHAEESGLAEELGVSAGPFEGIWFFNEAQMMTLEFLAMRSSKEDGVAPSETLRALIENQQQRNFDATLKSNGLKERSAIRKFCSELKDKADKGEIITHKAGHFTMRISDGKDDKGRARRVVYVEKAK